MTKLKTILEHQKLDHQEKVPMTKNEACWLMTALHAYGMTPDNYKFVPYKRKMREDTKALFPENATLLDAIMFVPYTQNTVRKILELAGTDRAVLQEHEQEQAEIHESAKLHTRGAATPCLN